LGGTSLLGLQLLARIQKNFGREIRAVKLYQYPTIKKLAKYLTEASNKQKSRQTLSPALVKESSDKKENTEGIAIVGMVGRFPGAANINEFWQHLCQGVESSTFFTKEQIDPSIDPEIVADPNYVRARGIIEGAELFDAGFFNISPREAEVMDPQCRVFLELAYEALENAGYAAESFAGKIGLYAGSGQNTYFENHLCGRTEIIDRLGAFQTMLANEKDFLTTRVAYKLNLTGPSISINTACSTSLVAIIQAFQGLRSHQCDMALAGGISINTPQNRGYLYQEGGMLSPDGRCRPFDAQGNGTMFNNGAGIVVLKRLKDAQADGDRIYAVIRGVGINNDGSDKVSFTAPSVNGQRDAILQAQLSGGINPETIDYIETHGTATHLGDPIELEALTQAFGTQTEGKQFCAIGSVKSNVGHLVAAAGVAGVIKTALALDNQQIPPSLNFESLNPEIELDDSPFYVNTKLVDWKSKTHPRRAGVSSFGVGGTNAHLILEEAPNPKPTSTSRPHHLLLLSAKTEAALEQKTQQLKNYLEQHPNSDIADIAFTLQQGRQTFNYRRFVTCQQRQEAIAALGSLPPIQTGTHHTQQRNPDVVFMFPGQGTQFVNMGANLYRDEPVFRNAVNCCCNILQPLLDQDLRTIIYPDEPNEASTTLLRQTVYTQPALFTVEYALAQLWLSWGIKPKAAIGHSIGEFVAACLAGVFSLEDALKLVAARGKMMWDLPSGAMLSVRLAAEKVEPLLNSELAIAAINGPALCVVSGTHEQIAKLQETLTTKEIACKALHTSHAFHSPMMDAIVKPFAEIVAQVELSPPQMPFISSVTADWITDAQATDPMYWANHLRATVRFAEGIQRLWQQPERVLLEVGPRNTTTTLARQQATDLQKQIAISSLGRKAEANEQWLAISQAIGELWLSGVSLDWQSFYLNEKRSRLPLPTYPFDRQRYWIDPLAARQENLSSPRENSVSQTSTTIIKNFINHPQELSTSMPDSRQQRLIPIVKEVLETTSGLELADISNDLTFLEMGLDSLSLTQVAIALKKKFKVKIAFRNLLEDYPNLDTLSAFLDQTLPADAFPAPAVAAAQPISSPPGSTMNASSGSNGNGNGNGNGITNYEVQPQLIPSGASSGLEAVVAQQLQIMNQQLELLRQGGVSVSSSTMTQQPTTTPPSIPPVNLAPAVKTTTEAEKPPKMHGPGAKIKKSQDTTLTSQQQQALEQLIARYTALTQESKRQAQSHRPYLSDPRTVSGFSPLLKEMVYPIVTDRSAGSRLWDVDGNEYIDLTNGFGLNFFGWSPEFVKQAVVAQMEKGIEIGPQTPLAGKVAKMVTEFTGMERVAFCNTGSEAVMAALRLARTVTGRNTVAIFKGGYHGTFDEVIVRSGANHKSLPAAPGIMASMFENILVLDYGTPESLEILRNQADDLAAIMVEPVQSRKPGLQPVEFLRDVRELTEKSETAFIFDEVVTGFRVHPGGAQAY
ncbi:MAG: aminotransferase class III-fold pyridoxal phosphate-dependent enzyme, partial [Cyanobacteria bacterium P01_A01_bin.83]